MQAVSQPNVVLNWAARICKHALPQKARKIYGAIADTQNVESSVLVVSKEIPGRGERIRTSDSCVPNAVLYQAELHPEFPTRFLVVALRALMVALYRKGA